MTEQLFDTGHLPRGYRLQDGCWNCRFRIAIHYCGKIVPPGMLDGNWWREHKIQLQSICDSWEHNPLKARPADAE